MVYQIIFYFIFLFSIQSKADTPELLSIFVNNNITPKCTKAVTVFLKDLKEISNDQVFELNSKLKTEDALELRCEQIQHRVESITAERRNSKLKITFLDTENGFDSLDLLEFQKKFLRPIPNLSPQNTALNESPSNSSNFLLENKEIKSQKESSNILLYTGALAGGVSGAVFSPNPESRLLNVLVFSAVGAITGYFIDQFIHKESK